VGERIVPIGIESSGKYNSPDRSSEDFTKFGKFQVEKKAASLGLRAH